jgi:cysteine desulfurase
VAYLDWNATAPLRLCARDAWLAAQEHAWANPSSIHQAGQQARLMLDEAKRTIARLLGAKPHELVLTSGGTEANALALSQVSGSIAASAIEHSSILRNAPRAQLLPVDGNGVPLLETLAPDTALVAFQAANNETGTTPDIATVVAAIRARAPQALILLDACQAAGKLPLDLRALGVDFASLTGHKFGGPKGCGVLYVRNGVRLTPLLRGGRQQMDRRSGTEDPALPAALAAALEEAVSGLAAESARQRALLENTFTTIQTALPATQWIARAAPRLANTLSLGHPGVDNELLVQRLDLRGHAVSVGAACMAGKGEPSHVIAALGVPRDLARGVIRVSIGHRTTADELAEFARAYVAEVLALLSNTPGAPPSGTSNGGSISRSTVWDAQAPACATATEPAPEKSLWNRPRHLPHFDTPGLLQAITYRLSDSLPTAVLDHINAKLALAAPSEHDRQQHILLGQALDAGHGSCLLRDPAHAKTVVEAWLHGDHSKYRLHAWVVMPNHVHVLVEPLAGNTVAHLVQSWKSFTSRRFASSDVGWQRDYFDRFIRDADHYWKTVRYIEDNPVHAGLVTRAEDWLWSSARR